MTVIMQHDRTKRYWYGKKVKNLTTKDRKTREQWKELETEMKKNGIYAFENLDTKEKCMTTLDYVRYQIHLR